MDTKVLDIIKALKEIYYIVRLVDVNSNTEFDVEEDGNVVEKKSKCFEVWGKIGRCVNCISSQAYHSKSQQEKFESIGDDIFYVISRYVELDGRAYILELVNKVNDKTFMGSIDRHLFAEQIQEYDKKLYVDALTGAYNRRYFVEQLQSLDDISAVAMFDMDHFKEINDTFGHQCGDEALRTVAKIIMGNIRNTDALVRYGGDEFIIVFTNIPRDAFEKKLEQLRGLVEDVRMEKYPDARITLSIGGIMSTVCSDFAVEKLDEKLYEAKVCRNCVAF